MKTYLSRRILCNRCQDKVAEFTVRNQDGSVSRLLCEQCANDEGFDTKTFDGTMEQER